MSKRTRLLMISCCLSVTLGCSSSNEPEQGTPAADSLGSTVDTLSPLGPNYCGDEDFPTAQTLETDEQVSAVLSGMSLTQKIDQMSGVKACTDLFNAADDDLADIRGFRFRDGPRGVKSEDGKSTCFPVPVARGATWDLELERRVGQAIGAEAKGLGYNVLLSPCINTLRHPAWGRAQETYGEDPWLLGSMGTAHTLGVQEHVPACIKHFAGNNSEDRRMKINAIIEEQTLRENYLRQFEMVIKGADPACVMTAYNKVNGTYCSENVPLVQDILKGEWGYDGFVLSDWGAVKSTAPSAIAGLDVEMPCQVNYAKLESAVTEGAVKESVIDDAVERVLRIKFKFGFARLTESVVADATVVESPEHTALALEAAQKSMVLLKNKNETLPIERAKVTSIAVVGHWADKARLGDAGSSNVFPSYAITPYAGIKSRAGANINVTTSTDISAAKDADIVVVVAALTDKDEGEAIFLGGDREDLNLPPEQEALINAVGALGKPVVVIMEASGPITTANWDASADAIVMAWYPGMEGGNAIGDLLFGDVNFSGRVIQTWPKKWSDEPEFGNQELETSYEYFHGYRHFDKEGIEPLYPFGFGMSYTTFEMSNLVVPCDTASESGEVTVSVDVKNTGKRDGVEVVQLYVSYPNTKQRRPKMELKSFTRVNLKVGETKTVKLSVRVQELAYWDVNKHSWVVEPVAHIIHVGHNQRNLPLTGEFVVVE